MPDIDILTGFVIAALVVLLLPGPGVLYVVARSVSQGRRAGLVSVLGLSFGAFVHVIAAAGGISAVILVSATAFSLVKLLGAAYLIYMGLQLLFGRSAHRLTETMPSTDHSMSRLFVDGVVISVLNPKIAVFFMAFLPQFVTPDAGPVAQQIFLLGLIYVGLALLSDGAYAVLAGSVGQRLRRRFTSTPWLRYSSGTVFLGLGLRTLLIEPPSR